MKTLIIRTYIFQLFFDLLEMAFNPIMPKDKKANWNKMRKSSYQTINELIKLKILSYS